MFIVNLRDQIAQKERHLLSKRYAPEGEPTFIPVELTGGMGDALLARATLNGLKQMGYQLSVYTQHAEALRYFFDEFPINQGEMPNFTWKLEIDSIARFKMSSRFSGFALEEHRDLFNNQRAWFIEHPELEELVQLHPKSKYLLTRRAEALGLNAETLPLACLGFYWPDRYPVRPRKAVANYITIHDGYDPNISIGQSDRSTKQWDLHHWTTLVGLIKKEAPYLQINQLGTKTGRPIPGAFNLINQTSQKEAFDLISHAMFHVDTDSGLAHAATALGVPVISLFGPTPESFYGYPQNINIRNTQECAGSCFHLEKSWMDACPIGHPKPLCMDSITPEEVMAQIRRAPDF